jgi:lipid-binding SYLF domain-containing protein
VALGKIGAEGSIDTTKIKQPIVGFVFGQTGLMAGASIEGAKFTKLKR